MTTSPAVGDRVRVEAREAPATPLRPGSVLRVERGEYGFEMVVHSVSGDVISGVVSGVWGLVPCA